MSSCRILKAFYFLYHFQERREIYFIAIIDVLTQYGVKKQVIYRLVLIVFEKETKTYHFTIHIMIGLVSLNEKRPPKQQRR